MSDEVREMWCVGAGATAPKLRQVSQYAYGRARFVQEPDGGCVYRIQGEHVSAKCRVEAFDTEREAWQELAERAQIRAKDARAKLEKAEKLAFAAAKRLREIDQEGTR